MLILEPTHLNQDDDRPQQPLIDPTTHELLFLVSSQSLLILSGWSGYAWATHRPKAQQCKMRSPPDFDIF